MNKEPGQLAYEAFHLEGAWEYSDFKDEWARVERACFDAAYERAAKIISQTTIGVLDGQIVFNDRLATEKTLLGCEEVERLVLKPLAAAILALKGEDNG